MTADVPDRASKTRRVGTKRADTRKVGAKIDAVAQEICVLFHEALRTEIGTLTKGGRTHAVKSHDMEEVDDSARRAFRAAARACVELGADAREFVVAQFARWREASAYHNKFLLPSPQHLATLSAQVRYLQYKTSVDIHRSRAAVVEDTDDRSRYYVEERQLRGFARAQRLDPADVLADQPERFSRAFLSHKGVWEAVKTLWEERMHS